jgi:HSP20 family protein
MAAMRMVGSDGRTALHTHVRESSAEYVVEVAVPDFTEAELSIGVCGRQVTIRGEQAETTEDDGQAFRVRERLEESFRLPDDAAVDLITVFYERETLELHVPREKPQPRPLPIEHRSCLVNTKAEAC